MKILVHNLTESQLIWAVAKAEGYIDDSNSWLYQTSVEEANDSDGWRPLTWGIAGPIIERENITVRPVFHAERTESGTDIYRQDGWAAHIEPKAFWVTPRPFTGPTPLIAAMRCYVMSRLGDEIEIPQELEYPNSNRPPTF